MSRAEMDQLGWDSCDIIIVTGDAYVDHPSFGMAVIGRVLEGQGFRVGIISQPDWRSADAFRALGKPNLFFGIAAGNMDSMINHYTADKKRRNDDAYTAGDVAGKRPDRAVTVYSQRAREAYKDVPVVIGGIEASLRRMAHYDYWSDKVRRSVLVDSKADILLYGNAERAIVDLAHGLAEGKTIEQLRHLRGTAYVTTAPEPGYRVIDSTSVDQPGKVDPHLNPYEGMEPEVCDSEAAKSDDDVLIHKRVRSHSKWCPSSRAAPLRGTLFAYPASRPSKTTLCFTHTQHASCTKKPTRITRSRSFKRTVTGRFGSIRHRSP